jgi:hypothetical protein
MRKVILAGFLAVLLAAPALAQVQGGNIAGTVKDEQGGVLPGVTVTLSGTDRTTVFITEANGQYRFLNLPPGTYRLAFEITGFTARTLSDIGLRVGANIDLPVTMSVAAVSETVTVSGTTPVVDTKAMGTATNFTQAELSAVPTSRDPWALLRTVPGVMVDRVNIAGNETGQQSNFMSKGTRPQDAVWTLDGVVVTDMSAYGGSPTYFNYDNFDEIQVSTSGQDIRQPTGGVGLNFVVKRGTNQFRGGFRGYFTGEGLEWANVPEELVNQGVTADTADHNKQITDYGFDIGGPILKDKAWFYASWASQDIRLVRYAGQQIDRTLLDTINVKGNWQATQKDLISVLWFLGAKEKYGRAVGQSGITFEADTATWNQTGVYTEGWPHGLLKIEDNRMFASNFFVSARYASYNTGFGLIPRGGLDMEGGASQVTGQSYGSYQQVEYLRPQHTIGADANYFATMLGASHEMKFGGGWRRNEQTVRQVWPGNMIYAQQYAVDNSTAFVYREGVGTDRIEFFNLYVGDTISKGRVTIDLGLRYDRQGGEALPSATQANKAFPELVPGISFDGYEAPFTWNTWAPRAGLTMGLDEGNRTVARASFSRYAGQLLTGIVGFSNPSASAGFAEYRWVDTNGDHLAQAGEVVTNLPPISFGGGFNPANPTGVTSANQIDPNLKAPITTSVVAGIDRELAPNVGLQVSYSYTRTTDQNGNFQSSFYRPWVGLTEADYIAGPVVSGTLPDGTAYSVPTYYPNAVKVAANGNSRILSTWPGFVSDYHGLEVQFVKRMANRWMARVGAAWNNARESYGDSPWNDLGNPTPTDLNPLQDGGPYVVRSGGSGSGDIFIHAKWQFNANAVYVFPWDIEVGANVFGRQGYPFPVYRTAGLGRDGTVRVLVSPEIDTYRLANLWNTDVRAAKSFTVGRMKAQIVADLFNLFNANTELVRNRNAGSTSFRSLAQNLSPRIIRFGLKVQF